MSFWRNLSKVIFGFSLIGSVIVSIAASIMMCDMFAHGTDSEKFLTGIVCFLIFESGFIVLHTFIAMFIELCDNISDIREKLFNSSNCAPSSSQHISSRLDKLSSISNDSNPNACDFWVCKECGTKNNRLESICKGCGKYK